MVTWARYVEDASKEHVEAAIEDVKSYEDEELREAGYEASKYLARQLDTDELKDLSVKGQKNMDRDLERVVNPILKGRKFEERFGDSENYLD